MLVIGSSGSGKSVLVFNIIKKFYKDYYDIIILISPTGKTDDIQLALDLPKNRVITDMAKAELAVQKMEDVQEEEIKNSGFEDTKKVLIYFDDCVGDPVFMKSKAMINAFIKNRHYNFSDILCSQYFKAIPKRMREQSACSIFFDCSETEMQTIAEDYLPPNVNKKVFIRKLQDILSEQYAFVTYMKRSPWPQRWRRGLAHVINFNEKELPKDNDDDEETEKRPTKKTKIVT
jgi:hypothetical protein